MRKEYIGLFTIIISIGLFVFGGYMLTLHKKNEVNNYEWYIEETKVYKVWEEYTGKDIIIAFLDSGISNEHISKYGDRIRNPYNFIDGTTDVLDLTGHGTAMISVTSGRFSEVGIHGIAPDTKIIPIVVMNDLGNTSGQLLSEGIYYAVDNGADIINLSLGSLIENELVKYAIEYAHENQVIVVAAGGDNRDSNILYPAKYETVIAVQAQSKLGVPYLHSSNGSEIDILIPGEIIKACGLTSRTFIVKNGSSISTALTSGIVALLLEKGLNYNEVMDYILSYSHEDLFIDIEKLVFNYVKIGG